MTTISHFLNIIFSSFILLILLELPITLAQIGLYGGTKTASRCFSKAGLPRIKFQECLPDEMILVLDAVQGIGQDVGQCQYRNGDCVEPTTTETDNKLRDECIGQSTCEITVSVAWMPQCSAYSSYNQVLYQCIPDAEVLDICQEIETSTSRNAFIRSPGYPFTYPEGVDCTCHLATDPGQRILLKFADYSLEWSENCEDDILQVMEGSSRMPRCGQLPRNYNITSQTHKVELHFQTNQWQQFKGFWLAIEALGNVKIRCGPTRTMQPPVDFDKTSRKTTIATTTTTSTTTTRAPPPPQLPPDEDYGKDYGHEGFILPPQQGIDDHFFDEENTEQQQQTADRNKDDDQSSTSNRGGVIAGVIIGCLLALVLIVVLVFLLVWFKRRRHKEEITSGHESTYRAKVGRRPTTPPGSPPGSPPTPPQTDTHV